ncbi:putative RNA recognition motif domain, nucleotide-binding alpha-beta plait domain superfamily [Helianthus annuus]|nr:putative RNA recognition motif domain, nucleotide-binding alpha-beta plait domain superfamily [Helianthus annuus]
MTTKYDEREEGEIDETSGKHDTGEGNGNEVHKESAITFYVSNIHPHISDGELWTECKNYGNIVDAYIARKLDKRGQRFGFLRFVKVKDADKMIKALNQMSFYGWKLRANVARFVKIEKKPGRNQNKTWVRKPDCNVNPGKLSEGGPSKSFVKQGWSWADVAMGKKIEREEESCLTFANESKAYTKWKGRSVLGELLNIEALRNVSIMKIQMGLTNAQVRYVGGLKLLLIFDTDEVMKEMLNEKEVWNAWFSSLEIWNGENIPFERIAWLRIRGVPLQLWINAVFDCIGEKYGRIVKKSEADEDDMDTEEIRDEEQNPVPSKEQPVNTLSANEKLDVGNEEAAWNDGQSMPEFAPAMVGKDASSNEVARNEKSAVDVRTEASHDREVNAGIGIMESTLSPLEKVGAEESQNSPQSLIIGGATIELNNGQPNHKEDRNIGPSKSAHKKRKRNSLAEARSLSLKPNVVVSKGKIPDLNVELSDESRLRPKKRSLHKKGKVNRKRGKVKIRILEEDINNFNQSGEGIEDDYNTEWEEESNADDARSESLISETQKEIIGNNLNEAEVDMEIRATHEVGLKLGVDLSQKESLVKETVVEDQADVRFQ